MLNIRSRVSQAPGEAGGRLPAARNHFVFVLFLGGPAPPEGQAGAHLPRDQKRIAQCDRDDITHTHAAARRVGPTIPVMLTHEARAHDFTK